MLLISASRVTHSQAVLTSRWKMHLVTMNAPVIWQVEHMLLKYKAIIFRQKSFWENLAAVAMRMVNLPMAKKKPCCSRRGYATDRTSSETSSQRGLMSHGKILCVTISHAFWNRSTLKKNAFCFSSSASRSLQVIIPTVCLARIWLTLRFPVACVSSIIQDTRVRKSLFKYVSLVCQLVFANLESIKKRKEFVLHTSWTSSALSCFLTSSLLKSMRLNSITK